MLDATLRPIANRALVGPARYLARRLSADALTGMALIAGLGAAGLAWRQAYLAAFGLWLAGRIFDGLDGLVARTTGQADDFGGFLDMLGDVIVYAAIPLGIALGRGDRAVWVAAAVLMASFYVNVVSWMFLAAVLEKRGRGAATTGELTSITMPPALVEGAETIVFFSAFLLFPSIALWLFGAMAALVWVNVLQRLIWAKRLRRPNR